MGPPATVLDLVHGKLNYHPLKKTAVAVKLDTNRDGEQVIDIRTIPVNYHVHVTRHAGHFAAWEKIGRLIIGKIELVLPSRLSQPW